MIYLKLFWEFFKVGLFTFGGGYAMIPLLKEVVLKYNWMNGDTFFDCIGICESTPGPIAVNMATLIGSSQAGLLGSIIATLGVILPSFIIIVIIAAFLHHFVKNQFVQSLMKGIRPVVIALILGTGIILLLKLFGLENSSSTLSVNLVVLFTLLILFLSSFLYQHFFHKKMNSILIILESGVLGVVLSILL